MPNTISVLETPPKAAPAAKTATWRMPRIGPVILIACLALAILLVLLIPMAVSGTVPASSHAVSAQQVEVNYTLYETPGEAAAVLGIEVALPVLPAGAAATQTRVVDGAVLEVDLSYEGQNFVYRAAAGNSDLSGVDYETVAYTATEDTAGMAVGYAGPSEKKLNAAVWAADDCSHALLSPAGVDSGAMKALATALV